ncbi:MAG TPA: cysteine--tRNA ligase [Syntrophomonadaceae bacterium]|nr:cysteine--tRNA ligase [Syntrophomonadaceae bacterium]
MKIYNTETRKKETLIPLDPHKVNIYVCGPTTYNYIHLGNARPLVVFDTVRRYLEYRNFEVNYIQNFTDVDDKIIQRAQEENADSLTLASHYIEEYFKDADALGIRRADVHPRVSQHIPDIIEAISQLIEKEYAYEVDGDVYFRVKNFKDYGKLSGHSLEDLRAGARVEVDERKEEPVDFALWKLAKPGEPAWESPWSKGRPGWHIECSVMSTKYLGDTIDIHGGGSDLIFPHHENEIAQAEALTGKTFVKYWMHNGFITINNEKMSKSLGNFFVLRDILAKYPADVVRFYLVATHYRSPLDFDDSKLDEARKALGRLKTTITLAEEIIDDKDLKLDSEIIDNKVSILVDGYQNDFLKAMDDDFNTAKAISHIFEISHTLNTYIADADHNDIVAQTTVKYGVKILKELGDVLGIFMLEEDTLVMGNEICEVFLDLRQILRKQKDFVRADEIRDFLNEQNIIIEDTAQASRVKYEEEPQMDELITWLINLRNVFKEQKDFTNADYIRDSLKEKGIILEDTMEGVRWKIAQA